MWELYPIREMMHNIVYKWVKLPPEDLIVNVSNCIKKIKNLVSSDLLNIFIHSICFPFTYLIHNTHKCFKEILQFLNFLFFRIIQLLI